MTRASDEHQELRRPVVSGVGRSSEVSTSRLEGTVDVDGGGRLVVHRPLAADDRWWREVSDDLSAAASALGKDRVVVERSRARILETLLGAGQAAGASWTWSQRATEVKAVDAIIASRLARVMRMPVEEQLVWPSDLDLRDHGFTRELRPFQRDAVARLLLGSGGADFSVPGAGKTSVAYATFAGLRARGDAHGMLVIAPTSAFEAWVEEMELCFSPSARPRVRVRPRYLTDSDVVVVTNYERLSDPRVVGDLREWARNRKVLTVFDEAHRAKAGEESRRGSSAARFARESDTTLVLTGTPMPCSESDLVAVFDLAWPAHGRRLVDGDLAHLRGRAFVRVTKADLDLPALDLRVERIELEPAHRALLDAMRSRVRRWASSGAVTPAEAGRVLMHIIAATTNPATVFDPAKPWSFPFDEPARPTVGEGIHAPVHNIRPAKIVRAAQIVAENRTAGRKTLVWTNFLGNVSALVEALSQHRPAVIVGATPIEDASAPTDRRRELERFRSDPECWVLVATPQTLGEGVSLHRCCTDQVHVDRGYAAATWLQSLDRTHRLGLPADARPTCTVLQATRTIDERIAEVLDQKVRAMAEALDDSSLRPMTDPMIIDDDPVAAILGDVDALRELLGPGG